MIKKEASAAAKNHSTLMYFKQNGGRQHQGLKQRFYQPNFHRKQQDNGGNHGQGSNSRNHPSKFWKCRKCGVNHKKHEKCSEVKSYQYYHKNSKFKSNNYLDATSNPSETLETYDFSDFFLHELK